VWGKIHVRPLVLASACPPAGGDHAGYYETSMLLAARPELVEQARLDETAPWYCHIGEERSSATASAEAGEEMLAAIVQAWVEELGRLV
jgi:creatinine amidohydrolase/Fe(II)-dependent formamide hydrolase-like protein